jgi:hypothetical protein
MGAMSNSLNQGSALSQGPTMSAAASLPAGGVADAGAAATTAGGSWAPYAMAGGSILSTLFSGLLQMEQQKERNIMELKAKQAQGAIDRSTAQNSALDRLMSVWRR